MKESDRQDMNTAASGRTLPPDQTALFCEQAAIVLRAGIPLTDAMSVVRTQYEGTRMYAALEKAEKALEESGSLLEAVKAAGCFPHYMVGMVQIGERAGKLDVIMQKLADYYEWEAKIHKSVRNAVFYPAVLVGMMAVVIIVLIAGVFPVFTQVYRALGVELSGNAITAINASIGFGRVVLCVLLLLLVLVGLLALLMRTGKRAAVTRFAMRTFPPIRKTMEKITSGRIALALSMTLESGYPLEEALELVAQVLDDAQARERVQHCLGKVSAGETFPAAMREAKLFDPMYMSMCTVGFEAGRMDEVTAHLAELYDEETDTQVQHLVSLIEPTLVGVLSVVVGVILLSVMLPLMSLMSSMI